MPKRIACDGGVWFSRLDMDTAKIQFYSPLCKRKNCPTCAKWRKLNIVIRIRQAMEATKDTHKWYFATITLMPDYRTEPLKSRGKKKIAHVWSKLRKRMARRWNNYGGIIWVRVWEFHEDDVPHAHFIIAIPNDYKRHIKTKWLKDNARECGGGYIALVGSRGAKDKPLNSDSGFEKAWYVAKYTAKSDMMGIRAIAWSENFPPQIFNADMDFSEWTYEGDNPDFDDWLRFVQIEYLTERRLGDGN